MTESDSDQSDTGFLCSDSPPTVSGSDSTYSPTEPKRKHVAGRWAPSRGGLGRHRGGGRGGGVGGLQRVDKSSSDSGSETGCSQGPSTSAQAVNEKNVQSWIDDLRGVKRKQRSRIKTTFVTEIEREPFRVGVCDLLENFGWTDREPATRPDFFQPTHQPGDVFNGDETPGQIFLSLHRPALELLLKAINETGREFVESGRWKHFREVDWPELMRFIVF